MQIHRWLARLYPPAVRREYAAAIEEMFVRRLADARARGRWALVCAWAREVAGIVAFAISERYRRHVIGPGKAGHMDRLGQDTRLAFRRLFRAPAFTAATILTLALAIGATTAIFAVVERVVINPLPMGDSERLVALQFTIPRASSPAMNSMPVGLYYQYATRARTLDGIAIYQAAERTLTGEGEPLRMNVVLASTSLARVLRVAPAIGRWFTEDEGKPGAPAAAVLSHALWTARFDGNPSVIGRSVTLDGVPTTVVGVMPASFTFPQASPVDGMWIADRLSPATGLGLFTHSGVARLRDGVSIDDARAELSHLITTLPDVYPGNPLAMALAKRVQLQSSPLPLKEWVIGSIARALWILLACVGLVMLVASANVANLFLVRSETRQREVAVRRALGASRAGVARFFMTESVLLSIAAGVLGVAIAAGAARLLVTYGPLTLPRLFEVRLDWRSVLFAAFLSALTALIFGTIPLLRRAPLVAALHEGGRGNTASRSRHRLRQLLMAGQVALALVVLIASGLMVRSLQQLRRVELGFNPAAATTFRIGLPESEYTTRATAATTHQAILDRLSRVPGVVSASATSGLPFSFGTYGNGAVVEGRVVPEGTMGPIVDIYAIGGGYVETMGMRVLRGRSLSRDDVERGRLVAVINQAMADAYFPGENPIGRRISSSNTQNLGAVRWVTVEGVVSNTPTSALNEPRARPKLYLPLTIAGGPDIPTAQLLGPSASNMIYVVRSAPNASLLQQLRAAIDDVDPKLAMSQVTTLQQMVDTSAAQMAFTMVLLTIAAAVALVLGIIGVYGVMAYIVTQRTGEIGIRLALGAAPFGVASMITRQGAVVALAGIVVGLAAAIAGGRFIESILFGVSARDPLVLSVTTVALAAVALCACWLPARRAAALSPLEALRPE
jgi:putative ABC transport system permease protein